MSPETTLTVAQFFDQISDIVEMNMVKQMGRMEKILDEVKMYPENRGAVVPATSIHENWLWFLQEKILIDAQDGFMVAEALGAISVIPRIFFPSLLYIKLVALFDEAVDYFITIQNLPISQQQNRGLDGRLSFLSQRGYLQYNKQTGDPLYDIKQKRNDLAHKPTDSAAWRTQQASLPDLEQAIDVIETVLQNLGLVGQRPHYEGYSESGGEAATPSKADVYMTRRYSMGVKENGKKIVEITHAWDYYPVDVGIREMLNAVLAQAVTEAINQATILIQGKTLE